MNGFREGDLVRVPLPDGRAVLAKVLYIGKRFKNVIGIGVCQWTAPSGTIRNLEIEPIKKPPLYTHIIAAKDYGWIVLGNRGLSEEEEQATLRTVAQGVYLKDERVRDATDKDREALHEMLAIGMPTVYQWAERLLCGLPVGVPDNPEQIPGQSGG